MIKKLVGLVLFALLVSPFIVAQTAFDNHLSVLTSAREAKVASISPTILSALSSSKGDRLDENTKEIIASLTAVKSMQIDSENAESLHSQANKDLVANDFLELLSLTKDGFDVSILARNMSGTMVDELIILKSNASSLYGSDMVGKIDLAKVKNLASVLNTPGLEYLDAINKEK